MPSCSARSPTAAGTAEPPSPIDRHERDVPLGIEVGMVEQAREEERRALARPSRPSSSIAASTRAGIPDVDEVDRLPRRYTGMSSAASMPMPWPTGAPDAAIGGGPSARPALHRAGGSRRRSCGASARRPSGRTSFPTCTRPARARRVDRAGASSGLVADEVGEREGRRPGVVADDRDPLEVGEVGAHRVEVREEVLVAEAVGGDERLHARAAEDVRRPPSARRSARSARRPRRGTRSRRTSPRLRASSAAGTRSGRRAPTPRAREPGRDPAGERVDVAERAAVRLAIRAHGERLRGGVVQPGGEHGCRASASSQKPSAHVAARDRRRGVDLAGA